jgi:hypothetical protein
VDHELERDLQLNVDLTVAMPCHCEYDCTVAFERELTLLDLTIDLRDAVGDRLHLSDDFVKEGVSAALPPGHATR